MEKRIVRFPVTKVHALPFCDDCYIHLRNPKKDGERKVGWLHLEGWDYPKVLRKAKNAVVTIEFEV